MNITKWKRKIISSILFWGFVPAVRCFRGAFFSSFPQKVSSFVAAGQKSFQSSPCDLRIRGWLSLLGSLPGTWWPSIYKWFISVGWFQIFTMEKWSFNHFHPFKTGCLGFQVDILGSCGPNRLEKIWARQIGSISPTWRIIPDSKWLVTPIHEPFRPFGKGTTPVRGLTITMVINHLQGMGWSSK